MEVRILLFAAAAQLAGQRSVEVTVTDGADLNQLSQILARQYPALQPLLPVSRWAIDHQFMHLSTQVAPGQEIALIPPVSGG